MSSYGVGGDPRVSNEKGYFYFGKNGDGVLTEYNRNGLSISNSYDVVHATRIRSQYIELNGWSRYGSSMPKRFKPNGMEYEDFDLDIAFLSPEYLRDGDRTFEEIIELSNINGCDDGYVILYKDEGRKMLMYY